ncbi:MAG: hypothetical protein WDN72_02650 [Alphaproteobacteria bacterium]
MAKGRTTNSSYQNLVRRIGAMQVEGDFEEHLDKLISRAATMREIMAVELWRQAYRGSSWAWKRLIRITDGPMDEEQLEREWGSGPINGSKEPSIAELIANIGKEVSNKAAPNGEGYPVTSEWLI